MTKGCGVTLRQASVSMPVHSQSTISTTTVHGAVVSMPSQLGCSGGGGLDGGGESGDGEVALDSATNINDMPATIASLPNRASTVVVICHPNHDHTVVAAELP